jgi:hypothetical protein
MSELYAFLNMRVKLTVWQARVKCRALSGTVPGADFGAVALVPLRRIVCAGRCMRFLRPGYCFVITWETGCADMVPVRPYPATVVPVMQDVIIMPPAVQSA